MEWHTPTCATRIFATLILIKVIRMEIHEFIIFLYLFVDLSSIGKKKKKKT